MSEHFKLLVPGAAPAGNVNVSAPYDGAHIATIPLKVIEQLAKHPLTDIGMEQFLADWEKRKK